MEILLGIGCFAAGLCAGAIVMLEVQRGSFARHTDAWLDIVESHRPKRREMPR